MRHSNLLVDHSADAPRTGPVPSPHPPWVVAPADEHDVSAAARRDTSLFRHPRSSYWASPAVMRPSPTARLSGTGHAPRTSAVLTTTASGVKRRREPSCMVEFGSESITGKYAGDGAVASGPNYRGPRLGQGANRADGLHHYQVL